MLVSLRTCSKGGNRKGVLTENESVSKARIYMSLHHIPPSWPVCLQTSRPQSPPDWDAYFCVGWRQNPATVWGRRYKSAISDWKAHQLIRVRRACCVVVIRRAHWPLFSGVATVNISVCQRDLWSAISVFGWTFCSPSQVCKTMSGSGKGLLGLWLYHSGDQEWAVKEGSPLHRRKEFAVIIASS